MNMNMNMFLLLITFKLITLTTETLISNRKQRVASRVGTQGTLGLTHDQERVPAQAGAVAEGSNGGGYGTTNADPGVGIGMKRGDSKI